MPQDQVYPIQDGSTRKRLAQIGDFQDLARAAPAGQDQVHAPALQNRPVDAIHLVQAVLDRPGPFRELLTVVHLRPDRIPLDGGLYPPDLALLHAVQLILASQAGLLAQDVAGIIARIGG